MIYGKTYLKIQQIARLRVGGLSDHIIASKMGMTHDGIRRIVNSPEYKQEEDAVMRGVVSQMDEALAGRADELRSMARVGVPIALQTLVEAAKQRRDLRAALQASSELLDRDPDKLFTKTSHRLSDDAPAVSESQLNDVAKQADSFAAKQPTAQVVAESVAGTVTTEGQKQVIN